MDMELFDDIAPKTVANFLDYVTSLDNVGLPKFNDTFVYRNIPGFVIQTGRFTFRPPDPDLHALISIKSPGADRSCFRTTQRSVTCCQ